MPEKFSSCLLSKDCAIITRALVPSWSVTAPSAALFEFALCSYKEDKASDRLLQYPLFVSNAMFMFSVYSAFYTGLQLLPPVFKDGFKVVLKFKAKLELVLLTNYIVLLSITVDFISNLSI